MNPLQSCMVGMLRLYRFAISPVFTVVFGPLGFGCRFNPTCSQYALEAVRRHGAGRGSLLALRRLARCHPWGSAGDDPVPLAGCCTGSSSTAVSAPDKEPSRP